MKTSMEMEKELSWAGFHRTLSVSVKPVLLLKYSPPILKKTKMKMMRKSRFPDDPRTSPEVVVESSRKLERMVVSD